MSSRDLSPAAPTEAGSHKPAPLAAVLAERRRRQAAEAKAIAAEQEATALKGQLDEALERLRVAEEKLAKYEAAATDGGARSLASLGLRYDRNTRTLSGVPTGKPLGLLDLVPSEPVGLLNMEGS
jgi:hypothetical protein